MKWLRLISVIFLLLPSAFNHGIVVSAQNIVDSPSAVFTEDDQDSRFEEIEASETSESSEVFDDGETDEKESQPGESNHQDESKAEANLVPEADLTDPSVANSQEDDNATEEPSLEEGLEESAQESEGKQLLTDNGSYIIEEVETEAHLRAILLGEPYDLEGETIDYGEIPDDALIEIMLEDEIYLTEPISDIQREYLHIGSYWNVEVIQRSAEAILSFAQNKELRFSKLYFQNVQSVGGIIQTKTDNPVFFTNVEFVLASANAQVFVNPMVDLFLEEFFVDYSASFNEAGTTDIIAKSITASGELDWITRIAGNQPFIETNRLVLADESYLYTRRSGLNQTGSLIHLTGSEPALLIGREVYADVRQIGMFVSTADSSYDSHMQVGEDSYLQFYLGEGLSGGTNRTLGSIHMEKGAVFYFSEFGTSDAGNPWINVGRSFTTADATGTSSVELEGERRENSQNLAPMIQLRADNAQMTLGEGTKIYGYQRGPIVTGTATSEIVLKDHVTIWFDGNHGFNGNTAVREIKIGDHFTFYLKELNRSENANFHYRTFFARSSIEIGDQARINVPRNHIPRQTSTANVLFGLEDDHGFLIIGDFAQLEVSQSGAFMHGDLAEIRVGKKLTMLGELGDGFTAGARDRNRNLVETFEIDEAAHIHILEHDESTGAPVFSVRTLLKLGGKSRFTYRDQSSSTNPFIRLESGGAAPRFVTGNEVFLSIDQEGPFITGHTVGEVLLGANNDLQLTTAHGFTGSTSSSNTLRRLIVGDETFISMSGSRPNQNQDFFRFREEIQFGKKTYLSVMHTQRYGNAPIFRLTQANSQFVTGEESQIDVDTGSYFIYGTGTTDVVFGDRSVNKVNAAWGLTANRTVRSVTFGKQAKMTLTEPRSGAIGEFSPSDDYARISVNQRVELLEKAVVTSVRERTTSDSRFIQLGAANSFVRIGKGAVMEVDQAGGIFIAQTTSTLILDEEAVFRGAAQGLNTSTRRQSHSRSHENAFASITIGPRATFILHDDQRHQGTGSAFLNRPLMNVRDRLTVLEDAHVELRTVRNKNEVLFFRRANAQLNIHDVRLFEISHPSVVSGQSVSQLQRLIRSQVHALNTGLRINITNQKLELWHDAAQETGHERFINVSGVIRINRNGNDRFPFSSSGRPRYLSVESMTGSLTSDTGSETEIQLAISRNNFNRLRFSEAEGLVVRVDPLSDQTSVISGSVNDQAEIIEMTYTNTAGETKTITPDTLDENGQPIIEWGEYRDEQQRFRNFSINLGEERLETDSTFHVHLSQPSNPSMEDADFERQVVKGISYHATNITLSRQQINELTSEEELHALILHETTSVATDVLTGADLTHTIRLKETDLRIDSEIDKTYYAVLEVGNKAYEIPIGIDVTSLLDQLIVRIPVKMIFESYSDRGGQNRRFESEAYTIQNDSLIPVEMKLNRFEVEDSEGIVVLQEGEDPLDYAELGEDEEDDRDFTIEDIRQPLLELYLHHGDESFQLYDQMPEAPLGRLAPRANSQIGLAGYYYGDYIEPEEDENENQFPQNLYPRYRFSLRFIPHQE